MNTNHKIDFDKVKTVADICAILKLIDLNVSDDGTDKFKDVRELYEEE